MIGYKFKITNNAGDFIYINDFTTDPLRFLALQDYPAFDVDIKNNEVAKEGQHGIFDFFSFYGKRVMNFSGVMVGEDEGDIETLKKQLLQIVSLPPIPSSTDDGYVTITWTDSNGDNWQIDGKLQGYPRFSRGLRQGSRLYFTLTLKAKNPEIESQEVTTETGYRGWPQGSALVPITLPAIFTTVYDKEFTCTNDGALTAHTVIRITGEDGITVTNPYILNRTTGKMFKVNIVLTGSDEYLDIDSKNGTVIDQNGDDQSGLVDGASEYILLAVGDNTVVYLSDESFGADSPVNTWIEPSAQISVAHRTSII